MLLDFTADSRLDPTADCHTATGLPLWYEHPWRTPIRPADLRIHLANARRYAGAVDCPILLHLAICVRIAKYLGYGACFIESVAAHDLHEAYTGDVPTMLKRRVVGWKEMEDAWEERVLAAVDLKVPTDSLKAAVKRVDLLALYGEMTALGHPAAPLVVLKNKGHPSTWGAPADLGLAEGVASRMRAGTDEMWWRTLTEILPCLGPA